MGSKDPNRNRLGLEFKNRREQVVRSVNPKGKGVNSRIQEPKKTRVFIVRSKNPSPKKKAGSLNSRTARSCDGVWTRRC
jgi:hypothetical protein